MHLPPYLAWLKELGLENGIYRCWNIVSDIHYGN